ncbi:hypothetical protein QA640_04595 [Bradyrhizobium sp. CB82]|uniref:hypothetical protein n=1 Tax=Bradyrhizobium sp. CB82 TaxID=3039159 RepID=UPI0024B19F78|nr:hypothetical protein [Bradyrhizobium sp. CB82]WFU41795.1 hypothetical protein QA640_04595 [Bradyrhizobium sp. CB82]
MTASQAADTASVLALLPTIDLETTNSTGWQSYIEAMKVFAKDNESFADDFVHPDGWTDVDKVWAVKAWIKNAANRDPSLANVKYLAQQMELGDFQETGIPLIFDAHKNGVDLQHRMLAQIITGLTVTHYVVNLRKDVPSIFAYYDQGKPRTHAEILKVAGYGEISGNLASAIKMQMHYEADCYSATKAKSLGKIAPKMVLDYIIANPQIRIAANLMAGEHRAARTVIAKPDVAVVVCFEILKAHDESVADEFFEEVGSEQREAAARAGEPVAVLQAELEADLNSRDPMARHNVLALVIKAFNAWIKQEPVKKLALRVNEPFPRVWGKVEVMAAAKAAE